MSLVDIVLVSLKSIRKMELLQYAVVRFIGAMIQAVAQQQQILRSNQ